MAAAVKVAPTAACASATMRGPALEMRLEPAGNIVERLGNGVTERK
jgi:hypothetical protein